jgi:hypothetical protein
VSIEQMPWCGVCKSYPNCPVRKKAGANAYLVFSCNQHSEIHEIQATPLGRKVLVWFFDFEVAKINQGGV